MALNMKSFTLDIEHKLDKAYKAGASKKFGFDEISNISQAADAVSSVSDTDSRLGQMKLQAKNYLDKSKVSKK